MDMGNDKITFKWDGGQFVPCFQSSNPKRAKEKEYSSVATNAYLLTSMFEVREDIAEYTNNYLLEEGKIFDMLISSVEDLKKVVEDARTLIEDFG